MMATATSNCPSTFPSQISRQISSPIERSQLGFRNFNGRGLYGRPFLPSISGATDGRKTPTASLSSPSAWDDKPYEVLPGGKRLYLDEQDIVTFLDPPKELVPLDAASFNPAAYLWKKIEDIPEERRHRLLRLIKPGLISRAWQIAGTQYEDPKLLKQSASSLLSNGNGVSSQEFWNCRTSGAPMPIGWINFFKKAIFRCKNGMVYGRLIELLPRLSLVPWHLISCHEPLELLLGAHIFIVCFRVFTPPDFLYGGSVISKFVNSIWPLYFAVRQLNEVMATEQPCDLAYEFGDGLLDIPEYPPGFPKPARHPWPFNDQVVIYVRHMGPGVLVGQAWQEGEELEKLPQKLCGEILMVKDYAPSGETE